MPEQNPIPDFADEIPQNVQNALWGILNHVYGSEVRDDIVTALTWGAENTFTVANFIEDLGLTVVDGKLHAIYDDGTSDEEEPVVDAGQQ